MNVKITIWNEKKVFIYGRNSSRFSSCTMVYIDDIPLFFFVWYSLAFLKAV